MSEEKERPEIDFPEQDKFQDFEEGDHTGISDFLYLNSDGDDMAVVDGNVTLKEPFLERIKILVGELESFGPVGYIKMDAWFYLPWRLCGYMVSAKDRAEEIGDLIERGTKNPCGTAACIAGKAALMPVFNEMGFFLKAADMGDNGNGFSISPSSFFGSTISDSVFTGRWAIENIHTPAQAAILIRNFIGDLKEAVLDTDYWEPSYEAKDEISALDVEVKDFPVSNVSFTRGRQDPDGEGFYAPDTKINWVIETGYESQKFKWADPDA